MKNYEYEEVLIHRVDETGVYLNAENDLVIRQISDRDEAIVVIPFDKIDVLIDRLYRLRELGKEQI